MAEQIPEAWIGQEVAIYPSTGSAQVGTPESINARGAVVRSKGEGDEEDLIGWYPITSVARIMPTRKEKPRQAQAFSF